MGKSRKLIPITKPSLDSQEADAAGETILSGWVTQGPRVKEFEDNFASRVKSRFACAVSNCTSALQLALHGVGTRPGNVVLVPSHSFIATANAIRQCGAEPVFVDIEAGSYNMDPVDLRRVLEEDCEMRDEGLYYKRASRLASGESPLRHTSQTGPKSALSFGCVSAVLVVHQLGFPCAMDAILEIATKFRLPVAEDAACAVGSQFLDTSTNSWQPIGKPHGKIACFSFHPRKLITTGDGGMLTTDQPELNQQFRLLRHHGMSISDVERHRAQKVIFERYLTTGYNFRMTDIQAAVGIVQLKKLGRILSQRQKIAKIYTERLANHPWIQVPQIPDYAAPNWQSYPVSLTDQAPYGQMELMQRLLDAGISTKPGVTNAHQEPAYSGLDWSLPRSESAKDHTVLLPLYETLTEQDLDHVLKTLHSLAKT